MSSLSDDLGNQVELETPVHAVVSIVPSLTESVASAAPEVLVGATDWCTEPGWLRVTRVGGTKNPDVDRIVRLAPDVVLANQEENRPDDLRRLRSAGIPVWVTAPRTVPDGLSSLERMLQALGLEPPRWLERARASWAGPLPPILARAVIPIWRRPWMAVGHGTFTGDVLRRLGVENVLANHPERYPRIDPDRLPAHDLVVLPDEPYPFAPEDGPEAFPGARHACVSGRHLEWYGPSLAVARDVLTRQLDLPSRL